MFTRIITAIVGVAVLVPMFLFADTAVLNAYVLLMTIIATYEILKCTKTLRIIAVSAPAFLLAAASPLLTAVLRHTGTAASFGPAVILFALIFAFLFYNITFSIFNSKKLDFITIVFVAFTCVYIVFGFSSIILLYDTEYGKYLFPLVFVASWASDIFAYFVGVFFGKRKLIPDVSPKKTVAGALGAVGGNILCFVIYGICVRGNMESGKFIILIVAAVLTSFVAQAGDLFMSLIKRRFEIKDFGRLLPGHGGVLDRFDSFIAVSPTIFFICAVVNHVAVL